MQESAYWAAAEARAAAADAADPLARFRDGFALPEGCVYLAGNSLGPAPRRSLATLDRAAREEWAVGLVGSWNAAGWFDLPCRLGDALAPVLGAAPGQVVVCDAISLNLYKVISAALALRPGRHVIVAEGAGFPTDLYVLEGLCQSRPELRLRLEGRDRAELEDLIDESVAVVLVNHVDYRSARRRDLAELTARIQASGALAVWDLSHSAGVMEIGLDAAEADLAVGCTYKYLNGGPGGPGFLYCAERHLADAVQPLTGWWGHADPFAFRPDFVPDSGIRKFLCGTQPVLSMRMVEAGIVLAAEAGPAALRAKSVALTERFIELVSEGCAGLGLQLISPREAECRGAHVALSHVEGRAVMQALIARGVVGDFRAPDTIRFGFSPLYVRHVDVVAAARALQDVLRTRAWAGESPSEAGVVT